jgi:glycerol kinase
MTAIGAAYLAGLAVGFWKSQEQLQQQWKINKSFKPTGADLKDKIKEWHRAVDAAKFWADSSKK